MSDWFYTIFYVKLLGNSKYSVYIGVLALASLNLSIKKRLMTILIISSVLFLALLVRVAYIQLIQGAQIQGKAFFQQNAVKSINPSRGNILDRNGSTLATSMPSETVVANPKDIAKAKGDVNLIAQKLEEVLGIKRDDIAKKLSNDTYFETIKAKIDKTTADKVRDIIKANEIKGIYLVEDSKRFYPNDNLASHVIGFTNSDGQGLQGIEKTMDNYLKGTPGEVFSEVDAGGRISPIQEAKKIDVQNGLNVVLTIDETIQSITSKALEEAIKKNNVVDGGVAIVMDPQNGDVLAMASYPDFNLNDPYKAPSDPSIDLKTWNGKSQKGVDILNKTVWRNQAVSNTYEPGSTFKAITSAAALEEGAVTPDTLVDDSPIRVDTWQIFSASGYNYRGKIPFKEGVYESSNPVFVRVAQALGLNRFYQYTRAFGLRDKTNINLPGEQNSIFQQKPGEVDLAANAFGQRFNITPIQLATAYTAIANGGKLMKPRLVKELTDSEGNVVKTFEPEVTRNVISKQTSDTLKQILEGVVSEGSGRGAYVQGYRIAGKTGTSETIVKDVYVASFAGIAPVDRPAINVLVTFFNPRVESYFGGTIAAPVAGKIIDETLTYLGIPKSGNESGN